MADVLSQDEIDNLLKALSSGDVDAETLSEEPDVVVKPYDFKRPSKFSKEHLRTLEIVFENYARLLSTNLPMYLRKVCPCNVVSSESITFSEFNNSLSNPDILCMVNLQPLPGTIMVEMSPNIGFTMIDRMLGGKGEPLDKNRDFSEIEISIIQKMAVIMVQLFREPWKNVEDISPLLERIEINPQFAQIISPNDMIALVTLNLKIGDTEGLMNVCLPFFTLESIMDRLNTKYWFSTMQNSNSVDYHEYVESMIKHVDAPLRVILGKTYIPVQDVYSLQLGDIIRLDTKVDDELEIYVGDIRKFKAAPGAADDQYAVRVTSVIREEED